MINKLIDRLIRRAKMTPYWHLTGYMERWWIVPYARERKLGFWRHPISWVLQRFDVAIRVHHILRSDADRAFHDHPWPYLTIILRGGYREVRPTFDKSGLYTGESSRWYGPGSIIFRRAHSWHRLIVPGGKTCWTLFITGRKVQSWGFLVNPRYKVYHKDYTPGSGT